MSPFTCDLVIAYYKEKLDWLKEFESFPFRTIYIYTKGKDPVLPFQRNTIQIIRLNNIGRCDHTYIYHMYTMYNNLADVTIFTTGSSHLPHKNTNLRFIVPKVFETKKSVFRVQHEPEYQKKFQEFKLNSWRSTNKNNQENTSKNVMVQSSLRPFGKWYDALFHGIETHYVVYGGVFAVSRAHIHHRTPKMYKAFLDQFPEHSNPEVGHYYERTWLTMFHPVPKECIYLEHENPPPNEIKYKGGGNSRKTRIRRKNGTRKSRNISYII